MKILVFSASPYLNTSIGKMCSSVVSGFAAEGHEVEIAAWDHNTDYYLPEKNRKYYFENKGKKHLLYALDSLSDKTSVEMFEIIKSSNPDVVVSLGNYWETACISSIKSIRPRWFSWVSILMTGRMPVEPSFQDVLDCADEIITTTQQGFEIISKLTPTNVSYVPYGYDENIFRPCDKKYKLSIVANLKNTQNSNLPAYLMSLSRLKHHFGISFSSYLHTNIDDVGEYDIKSLIKEYDIEDVIELPKQFVAVWHGDADMELRSRYESSLVVVDTSMHASTGISVLEAMASGCIPLVAETGIFTEIIEDKTNFISSNTFIGEKHHRLEIISPFSLALKLKKINDCSTYEKNKKMMKSIKKSKRYIENRFVIDISKIVDKAVSGSPALAVYPLT